MNSNNLCEENYFSQENNIKYTGSSQIKDFIKCEACALAKLKNEFIEEPSNAMLVSSYIDEAISGTLDIFKAKHPEILLKNGELKAPYKIADSVLNQIENDEMFFKYLSGEHQVIMTGEISNVPVKIKIDSYFKNKAIIDLKAMANLDLIWNEVTGQKENFIDYYNYILQGALYQEIVRQNTGNKLPFIIAVATKQEYSRRALLEIPQEKMNIELEKLKQYLPILQKIKEGKVESIACHHCDYCISKQKVEKIYYYDEFFKEEN